MYVMIHVLQLGHHTMVFLYNSISARFKKRNPEYCKNYKGFH